MGFSYFPHTAADIGEMLKRIGVDGLDDLYADVPRSVIFDGDYDLPDACRKWRCAVVLRSSTGKTDI